MSIRDWNIKLTDLRNGRSMRKAYEKEVETLKKSGLLSRTKDFKGAPHPYSEEEEFAENVKARREEKKIDKIYNQQLKEQAENAEQSTRTIFTGKSQIERNFILFCNSIENSKTFNPLRAQCNLYRRLVDSQNFLKAIITAMKNNQRSIDRLNLVFKQPNRFLRIALNYHRFIFRYPQRTFEIQEKIREIENLLNTILKKKIKELQKILIEKDIDETFEACGEINLFGAQHVYVKEENDKKKIVIENLASK